MKIVGYVYGKNVVGKPINQVMVSYIGLKDDEKKLKKSEKKPWLSRFFVVRSSMNNERITNLKGKKSYE